MFMFLKKILDILKKWKIVNEKMKRKSHGENLGGV